MRLNQCSSDKHIYCFNCEKDLWNMCSTEWFEVEIKGIKTYTCSFECGLKAEAKIRKMIKHTFDI